MSSPFWYFLLLSLVLAEGALLVRFAPASWRDKWQATRGSRRESLDGLRGILAACVFLHHCVTSRAHLITGNWDSTVSLFYAQMGVAPVTLFFFITGFLFWKKLISGRSITFRGFLKERLLRLGPAYWAACCLFFVAVARWSNFAPQVSLRMLSLQAMGWLSFLGAGHDMNAVLGSTRIFGQVWTLRLEWMFYLSLPLLGWFARGRARLIALLAGASIAYVASEHLNMRPGALQFVWKTFGDYCGFLSATFGIGMIVATIPERDSLKKLAQSRLAAVLGISALACTVCFLPARYGWIESLALALPFLLVCFGNTFFGLLNSRAALLLGTISYSFYLLHSLVLHAGSSLLEAAVNVYPKSDVAYWAACSLIGTASLLLSSAWWIYLEQPFLKRKGPAGVTRRTSVVPATGGSFPNVGLPESAVLLHASSSQTE